MYEIPWKMMHSWVENNLLSLLWVGIGITCLLWVLVHQWERSLWMFSVRYWLRGQYNRFIRNPISKITSPLRRVHTKWSRKNMGKKMAKWKKGHLADVFCSVVLDEQVAGRLSKQEARHLMNKLSEFFELPDLHSRGRHPQAVRERLKHNSEYMIGPKGPIPGVKPPQEIQPNTFGLGSKFLARKQRSAK